MPRYFFDLDLNGQVQQDTTGRELEDRDAARTRANDVIMGITSIWDHARALRCACSVRDEQGGHVYRHSHVSEAVTPEIIQAVAERKARRAEARAARLTAQGPKPRVQR
jgi:hypothetical protein